MAFQCLTRPRGAASRSSLFLLVICFAALGFCFHAVPGPSQEVPLLLQTDLQMLKFDDIATPSGFANITAPYNGLLFDGFLAFNPAHPKFKGIISSHDLNCAVSKPNALYGTRDNFKSGSLPPQNSGFDRKPSIRPADPNRTFTLQTLSIKPLDVPLGLVTVTLRGIRPVHDTSSLNWSVDFPAGFHEVLYVPIEDFSKQAWTGLKSVEVWADFHHSGVSMDWEFCIDDLNVELTID